MPILGIPGLPQLPAPVRHGIVRPRHRVRDTRPSICEQDFMSALSKTDVEPGFVQPAAGVAALPAEPTKKARRSLRPLLGLIPFVTRYKVRATAALVALL